MKSAIVRSCTPPALVAALLVAPGAARACAVCAAALNDESRIAFLATTVFLSVLPLALVGGAVWWIRRRVSALEQAQAESSEEVAWRRPPFGASKSV